MSDNKQELGWTVVELMGHRRLGAFVTEQEVAGHGFLRLEIPGDDGAPAATQFVSPASVYCLTPTTEAMARAVAARNQPQPVQRWELPQPKANTRNGSRCSKCGLLWEALCGHCGETHPCSCTDEELTEVSASRRGYEFNGESKTDQDDF